MTSQKKFHIFDGLDLVSKEIIENNFSDKKEIKANIWAEAFRDAVPLSKLNWLKHKTSLPYFGVKLSRVCLKVTYS